MKPTSRLKGTLVEQSTSAQGLSEGLRAASAIGIEVEYGPDAHVKAVGPAEVIADVTLRGLIHISSRSIDRFRADHVGQNGKFGRGTYFAAGALTGETYDVLMRPGNVAHEANVHGTVMVVDREDVKVLEFMLKQQKGTPASKLKTRIPNADITGLAPVGVDVLMVFMDKTKTAAEIVVFADSTDSVEITSRRTIN